MPILVSKKEPHNECQFAMNVLPHTEPKKNLMNAIGVRILKRPEKSEFGTFVWISDPNGRWIEIWER
jgi:predicted enzyme related to lactoylglutathione lyase